MVLFILTPFLFYFNPKKRDTGTGLCFQPARCLYSSQTVSHQSGSVCYKCRVRPSFSLVLFLTLVLHHVHTIVDSGGHHASRRESFNRSHIVISSRWASSFFPVPDLSQRKRFSPAHTPSSPSLKAVAVASDGIAVDTTIYISIVDK